VPSPIDQLADAVRAGDLEQVRAIIQASPELVTTDLAYENEHQVLHYAVYNRSPEMVRLLMEHGANARKGVWPHREATTALEIATDRGYDEIVAIIFEEESRRPRVPKDELLRALDDSDEDRAMALLAADPTRIKAHRRPLHAASYRFWERLATWLLDRGYDVNQTLDRGDWTPLDMISGSYRQPYPADRIRKMVEFLQQRGAKMTPRAAVMLGEAEWLRARHAEGALANVPTVRPHDEYGGLLTIAVIHDRPDILELLLDLGFDPNERVRFDVPEEGVYTWGMPLSQCAKLGKLAMAETLLARGADPNPKVTDGKPPSSWAYEKRDWEMLGLLERHGGWVHPVAIGINGDTVRTSKLFADEAAGRLPEGMIPPNESLAELLLWSSAAGEHPEVVQMALEHMTWPRDDPRWWWMLWHPLFRCLECFRLVLKYCNPDVSLFFGRTSLHDAIGLHVREKPTDRAAFVTALLDAGARTDIRDDLLKSTPLGWACRWGRVDLVKLLLERGADPVESDAEPWAKPLAWAQRMKQDEVYSMIHALSTNNASRTPGGSFG
jgi:ankyrin repeat protein